MTDFIDLERQIDREGERRVIEPPGTPSTAVVVAGMHRSGTSALVRVLALLGLDLPKTPYPARPDNPLGYWESLLVVEAHEEFLAAVGSSFDDVFPLAPEVFRSEPARALEDRLVAILGDEFAGSRQFVLKDPRLCRLLPIWVGALQRFGAVPRFVIPVRNPLEVAASLKQRNEYSGTRSLLLWLRHVLEAERASRGFRRSVVSYENLLRDWHGAIEKIAHELSIVWPRSTPTAHAEIEQFLSPRRRHHSFTRAEVEMRADVADWVKRTYAVLVAAADGEQVEQDVLDDVAEELHAADLVFSPLLAAAAKERKREVEKASERATKARQRADTLAAKLAARRDDLVAARQEAEQLATESATRQRAVEEAGRRVEEIEARLEETARITTTREAELRRARDEVSRLRADTGRLAGKVTAGVEALAARDRQRRQLVRELASRDEALAALNSTLESLEAERQEVESAVQAARARANELRAERDERDARIESLESAAAKDAVERARQARTAAERLAEANRLRGTADELARSAESAKARLRQVRGNLVAAEARLEAASDGLDRLTRALADREAALAVRMEEGKRDAERISSLEADLEGRRIRLRRRRKGSSPPSRYRSLSQFGSWIRRPRSGGWGFISEYFALRRSGGFDPAAYLAVNGDVRVAGMNPLMHYVEHGRREGRDPSGAAPLSAPDHPYSPLPAPVAHQGSPPETPGPPPGGLRPAESTSPPPPESAESTDLSEDEPDAANASTLFLQAQAAVPGPIVVHQSPQTDTTFVSEAHSTSIAVMPEPVLDFSDFIVLLARQRSGTNALRSVLDSHRDIACFPELFSVIARDSNEPRTREVNFLNFAARKDPHWSQPGRGDHRKLFLDFLEYIRCFSPKKYSLIDIKYNTTHILAEAWANSFTSPLLFDLILEANIKVINVTRKNYLRFVLSNQKALDSGWWHIFGDNQEDYRDRPMRLDCASLLEEFRIRSEEDALIGKRFEGYPGYLAYEYAELFDSNGELSPALRRAVSELLEIDDEWGSPLDDGTLRPVFLKQSSLPLVDTIENYDEVAEALRGTEFEWFLEDEPQYRAS